ncbi:MAG: LysM peptidoglycan-binding domain-containing protein [Actinomycetota bacterium]|nr:LysM peptidoglycan-binding domain-containing protein [Actinomycetota bacterium]
MSSQLGSAARRRLAGACVAVLAGSIYVPSQADAALPHVVQPGETLWSISAANNLTTRTVAVFNGLPEDAFVVEGQTVNVPTVDEGAAALISAGITPGSNIGSGTSTMSSGGAGHTVVWGESLSSVAAANGISIDSLAAANGLATDSFLIEGQSITIPATTAGTSATAGLGHIPSPYGELHLDPAAADTWNAMRDDSLANYGVDLYPEGTASAYRTTEQQQQLYDLYLSGQGAPANPPGTSSHEVGVAVDVAEPVMRDVIDQIGGGYGWSGTIPSEWWHVQYGW